MLFDIPERCVNYIFSLHWKPFFLQKVRQKIVSFVFLQAQFWIVP